MNVKKNQSGFTLFEVVASLAIVIIILLSFSTLLLSGAKSTKNADDMFNATYYAQKKMEEIYNDSKVELDPSKVSGLIKALPSNGNILADYQYLDSNNSYFYTVRVKNYTNTSNPIGVATDVTKLNLRHIIIELRKTENGPIKAKMENIIEWSGS